MTLKTILSFVLTVLTVTPLFSQELFSQGRDLGIESKSTTANTFVLLIGINKYPPEIPSLDYCVRDTEGLAKSLQKIGVPTEQIIVMVDDAEKVAFRPSRTNIIRQIEMVTQLVTESDQLVVAFSGHGAQMDGEAYLCPNDTDLEKANSFLPRKWVYEQLEKCPARKKLFISDACRNEIKMPGARSVAGVKSLADPLGDTDSHGFAILASCSKNQKSYEDEKFEHGVFTYFVMQGLEGAADADKDGRVTFEELYRFVMRNTRQHVLTTRQTAQVPVRGGEYSGDFVLVEIGQSAVTPAPTASTQNITTAPATAQPSTNSSREIYTTLELPTPAVIPPIPEGRRVNVSTASELLDATQNAKDGDVIVLAKGTYMLSEDIDFGENKGKIALYGDPENPQNVKIRINGEYGTIRIGSGSHLKLIGLDISNQWRGVYANYGNADILFCHAHDCGDYGVCNSSRKSNVNIENSMIVANTDWGCCSVNGNLVVKNCLIKNNTGSGVYTSGGRTTLTGCEIVNNGTQGLSFSDSGTRVVVTDCKIRDNKENGVWVTLGASGEFRNNTLSGNKAGNWEINSSAGEITRIGNTPNE